MSILIISGIEGVRNCAETFSKQLEMKVDVADGRRQPWLPCARKNMLRW